MFPEPKIGFRYITTLAAACFLIGVGGAAAADGDEPWKVEGKLIGKPKSADGLDSKKSNDVSGIACASTSGFPRICLLADDETQGAQVVILKKDKVIAGDFIRLIHNTHDGKLVELDAEGVGYADGSFYVIGSHGRPRHEVDPTKEAENKAKAEASRHVFRVRFDLSSVSDDGKLGGAVEIKPSTELPKFIQAQPALASKFDAALDDNGLTIEGVAVRSGRLYAGMRGPVLDNRDAAILSVPLTALFDGEKGDGQLDRLNLGTDTRNKARGVRDLVAFENGFLVLAGPVNDPRNDEVKPGDYSVFWWEDNTLNRLLDLKAYGTKIKPEALVPLDQKQDKLRVLLFFDGPDEGKPRAVELTR